MNGRRNFIEILSLKIYSKWMVGETCRSITDAFGKMRALVIRTWYDVEMVSHSSKESILRTVTRPANLAGNSGNSRTLLPQYAYTENVR